MVMSVTQERRRWTGISVVGVPMSHQNPTKNFGETLLVRWTVRNDGGASASVQMGVLNPAVPGGLITSGVAVTLGPGLTIDLIVSSPSLVNGVHAIPGANACEVQIKQIIAGVPAGATIASHPFTLTMNQPALIVAVGDPTIS